MKKTLAFAVIVMAVFGGCGGSSSTQVPVVSQTYTVSGKVAQTDGGLAGVTVSLTGPGYEYSTVQTAWDGTYSFITVKNGSYILSASLAGYTISPDQTITVNGQNIASLNFSASGAWLPIGNIYSDPSYSVLTTIDSLAIDPINSLTIYAGNDYDVFKSTDGGKSWNVSGNGLTGFGFSSLAIDPNNNSNVYAVGAGSGVFKSTDAGNSWNSISNGLPASSVRSVAIDSHNTQTLYVGTYSSGVFKSTDGGGSWRAINNGINDLYITSLAIDPTNSQNIYVSTMAILNFDIGLTLGGVVYKSTDGGTSWNSLNMGGQYLSLAINPLNGQNVFATSISGAFTSSDGGATWSSFGGRVGSGEILAIDPVDSHKMYLVNMGHVYSSSDGGNSWIGTFSGIKGRATCLAIDPVNSQNVYVGTDFGGGVYQLANAPAAQAKRMQDQVLMNDNLSGSSNRTRGPVSAVSDSR